VSTILDSLTPVIEFGRFRISPHRRELLADGRPVDLGGRAFDVLMALVEAHGSVVSKDELLRRVWPGRIVEESGLLVQISTLRKALGRHRDLIKTIAGRGYQFTGDLRRAMNAEDLASLPPPQSPPTNLREPMSELIGRHAEVRSVTDLLLTHRLVTLTGAGGIGKTRLALEVARQVLPRHADGVWIAELGSLTDPGLVPVAVATALGLTLKADVVTPDVVATAIGAKRVLLVLDNCEHLIEAVTRMGEALLSASSAICLLVTSREALRTDGEWIYPVSPLEVPAEGTQDAEGLLRSSSVKLFIARARPLAPDFMTDEQMTRTIGRICRRLDGIPLAIELAAVRASALGVEGVADRLDDRFRLLTGGLRTALLRHQTMRATLDWSYELLPEPERIVLRRVAIFAGSFTLESAGSVATSQDMPSAVVVDCIVNLVAKSLVSVNVGRPNVQYRLLETTRAYGLEKLVDSGELEGFARRHAEYYRDVFEGLANEWRTQPRSAWLATYGRQVDNLRAALDWAFSPNGDAPIAIALTIAAVPLWFQLSLMEECHARVQRALDIAGLETGTDRSRTRDQMKLYAALGAAMLQTMGAGAKMKATWTHALEIAESLGDMDYALRALWGVWASCLLSGDAKSMLPLAHRFQALAANSTDPLDILIAERLLGVSLHYQGNQTKAQRHIERMLSHYAAPYRSGAVIRFQIDQLRFQIDQRIAARAYHTRALWLLGLPDQAMGSAQQCVDEAEASGHTLSLCHGLAHGPCSVAILAGDLATADRFVMMLLERSAQDGLNAMHAMGRCFESMLVIRHGELDTGSRLLRAAIDELDQREFALFRPGFLCALGEVLARTGRIAEGRTTIEEGLERCERDEEFWCIAELLRVKGELELQLHSPAASSTAEDYFLQAIDWARRQNALSWELRATMSLARLRHHQNRTPKARKLLATVYDRFTEGFETADLMAAKALLETIG
jgi:predicted ATPase/DNA-binding winged helix-turn-helix (wHTH) protein